MSVSSKRLEYLANRRAFHRAFILNALGNKCAKCESTTARLEIDHIDRATKTVAINNLLTHSLAKIKLEIIKCQLLCEQCHRRKNSVEQLTFKCKRGHNKVPYKYCKRCDADNRARRRRERSFPSNNANDKTTTTLNKENKNNG